MNCNYLPTSINLTYLKFSGKRVTKEYEQRGSIYIKFINNTLFWGLN